MLALLLSRLARIVVSLFIVSLITFGLLQLVPGSFSDIAQLGGSTGIGGGDTGRVSGQLSQGGSREPPAWEQYLTFMKGFVTLDMGPSYKYPTMSIEDLIAEALPVSLSLAVMATALTLLLAIPLGMLAAVRKGTAGDYGPMFIVTTMTALPGYLSALLLLIVLAAWLDLVPTSGWSGPSSMVIPVIALAVQPTAILARYVRSSILEQLGEEYVVAALAKGGTFSTVLIRHVLRNSLIPLVTVVGPMFASLATGTVFIEALLGIPGLGQLFATAARTRDMPLLMATTLLFALFIMVMNLLVDLTYGWLDPRLRTQRRLRTRRPVEPDGGVMAAAVDAFGGAGSESPGGVRR